MTSRSKRVCHVLVVGMARKTERLVREIEKHLKDHDPIKDLTVWIEFRADARFRPQLQFTDREIDLVIIDATKVVTQRTLTNIPTEFEALVKELRDRKAAQLVVMKNPESEHFTDALREEGFRVTDKVDYAKLMDHLSEQYATS